MKFDLSRTTDGLILRDQFNRDDSGTVGNGWSEYNGGTISIASNAVKATGTDIEQHIYRTQAQADDFIVQCNVQNNGAGPFAKGSDFGGATFDGFFFVAEIFTSPDRWALYDTTNGSFSLSGASSVGANNLTDKWATARLVGEKSGANVLLRGYGKTPIADQNDLSNDLTLEVSATETERTGTETGWRGFGGPAGDHHDTYCDEYFVCGRNVVVTGLPSSYEVRIDNRSTTAESSGTATIDVDTFALPATAVTVIDDVGNVVATITPTDGVWGGDVYDLVPVSGSMRLDGILVKVESAAGTYETPSATTDAVRISRRAWTSIRHARVAKNLRRGVASGSIIPANPGIPRGPLMTLSIAAELKGLGAAYGASSRHELDALFRACGMSVTVDATPGAESLTYAPETTTHETCSIEAYGGSLKFKITGCRGNFQLPLNAGELGLGFFMMQGWLEEDPIQAGLPTITYDDVDPPPWTTTAIAIDGWAAADLVPVGGDFDLGQKVKAVRSANPSNGIEEVAIVKTSPVFVAQVQTNVGQYEPFAQLAVTSSGALNVQLGSTQYNRATLSDSAAQLTPDGIAPIDLDGFAGLELKYFCPGPVLVFN